MPQVTIAQAAEIEAATKVVKMFEPWGPVWMLVIFLLVILTVFLGLVLYFMFTRGDAYLTSSKNSMTEMGEQAKRQNDILQGCQLTLESQNETLKAVNKTQDRQELLLQEVLTHSRRLKHPVSIEEPQHLPAPG